MDCAVIRYQKLDGRRSYGQRFGVEIEQFDSPRITINREQFYFTGQYLGVKFSIVDLIHCLRPHPFPILARAVHRVRSRRGTDQGPCCPALCPFNNPVVNRGHSCSILLLVGYFLWRYVSVGYIIVVHPVHLATLDMYVACLIPLFSHQLPGPLIQSLYYLNAVMCLIHPVSSEWMSLIEKQRRPASGPSRRSI